VVQSSVLPFSEIWRTGPGPGPPKKGVQDRTGPDLKTLPITEEDIPRLWNQWFQDYNNILSGMVPKLPPLREVNHRIPLIDEGKQYSYHFPRCPDALKQQLSDKIRAYTDTGWWEMKSVPQAAPMLCILKKTGKL